MDAIVVEVKAMGPPLSIWYPLRLWVDTIETQSPPPNVELALIKHPRFNYPRAKLRKRVLHTERLSSDEGIADA